MISFREHLSAWKKVIFALYLRELQSKFNDKLGLSWAFFEPFLFIFVMSFVRGFISGKIVHSIPLFAFMMIGLVGIQSFMSSLSNVSGSIKKNKPLYAFRQVQPLSSVITSGFLEFIIKCGVILLLSLALYLTDSTFVIDDPLLLIYLFLSLWAFSISLSLLFGIAASFVPEVNKLRSMLTRPLFFISCTFFSLQDIPEEYWPWLTWNPLVHFIELARYACFPSYGDKGVSLQFATECTLITVFFSLAVYHISWKKLLAR
ncbi:ABC transporter permease [Alteromonas pelagimontana]|uniref:ABC transporter permease n=1 Tax=Alteromonas pelagimontana TaxID=1858656 RepID=A0A6M4MFU3_9ALTE|nr:ABC transporter permease [Alteromonas pelagimontana]QJR81748.1 ABC transporter permease [Alteromonas pelagimontana]